MHRRSAVIASLIALLISGCAKQVHVFKEDSKDVGYASWYGSKFHGRRTASGEIYDMHAPTAAHRTAPFQSRVRVTNLENQRSTVVRINDRGPFIRGRIIDLSYAAAKEIGLVAKGTARVRLDFQGKIPQPPPGGFFVQVGSFRDPGNARRLVDELEDRFPEQSTQVRDFKGYHRVWVGPLKSEERASVAANELHRAGYNVLILRQ